MKKKLKQYSRLIPLILYPYTYLIVLVIFFISNLDENGISILYWLGIIYNIYVLCLSIYHSITVVRKQIPARDAASTNLLVKTLQIPSYIFHCLMLFIGMAMGIWGIGFSIVALTVNVLSILLTGISAIGCCVRMKQEGYLSTGLVILMMIGSFLIFLDIVVAIAFVIISRKKQITDTGKNFYQSVKQSFSQNGE